MPRNVLENVSPYRKNTILCGFCPSGNTRSALTNGFSQRKPPRPLIWLEGHGGTCCYVALPNGILECLARLEGRHLAGGVGHGFAGAGVAAHTGRALLYLEAAKAHHLHLVSALHGGFHCAGKGGEGRFAVLLRQAAVFILLFVAVCPYYSGKRENLSTAGLCHFCDAPWRTVCIRLPSCLLPVSSCRRKSAVLHPGNHPCAFCQRCM